MPRTEHNAINWVLRARGLGTLEEPGTVAQLAYMVEDHLHFMELLRACEPSLRRDMYEAMRPHLRFPAHPLDRYIAAAGESAEAAELPTLDAAGGLRPYMAHSIPEEVSMPVPYELRVKCHRCGKEQLFYGERLIDAIRTARHHGWAYDEFLIKHYCPECLDGLDEEASQKIVE